MSDSQLNYDAVYEKVREWRQILAPDCRTRDDELDVALYRIQMLVIDRKTAKLTETGICVREYSIFRMIARRLSIDPALLVSMFSRPDGWRVVANRLPEDAKVDRIEAESVPEWNRNTIHIWITSSVFRDDDPLNLPAVKFEAVMNMSATSGASCKPGKSVLTTHG